MLLTVFVVEDDDGIRQAVVDTVEDRGHDVRGFADAESALAACRAGLPDLAAGVLRRIARVQQEGLTADLVEEKLVLRDGSTIDAEVHSFPIELQGRTASQVIVHDLTARKRAAEALARAQERAAESEKMRALG